MAPRVVDLVQARALVGEIEQGLALGDLTEAGAPLVVVDLDSPGEVATFRVPVLMPVVVVGISRGSSPPPVPEWAVDVAVTDAEQPPAPWVACPDVVAELESLEASVARSAEASVTLVHVLRAGAGLPVAAGLALESLAYSTLQGGPEFGRWLETEKPSSRPSAGDDPVLVERHGEVLRIVLNRPTVHNAYNAAMREALCDALAIAVEDASIREVEVLGNGPSFCSGGDLTEFGSFTDSATAHLIRTSRSPARLLAALGERVTAHLHGACVGSGIELPAFAGTVVAAENTQIHLPETSMGLIPGAGGTVSLSRRIGAQRTAWLVLSGRTIGARTAHRWGLVDAVAG